MKKKNEFQQCATKREFYQWNFHSFNIITCDHIANKTDSKHVYTSTNYICNWFITAWTV